jgi:ferredoxin-nitrite reductase
VNAADADPAMSFTQEQKEYLQGFTAGLAAAGAVPIATPDLPGAGISSPAAPPSWFGWPVDEITREEQLKREENPLDIWDKLLAHAEQDQPPQAGDVYRFKFHGLFYVAPAQDSLMVRVRIPGNAMTGLQMRTLAGIASDLGGGYGDITTRGNIQIREIAPRHMVEVLMRLAESGLTSRGAGADNVRNITSSPLSGIDPTELIDTRPLARALQFYLLNNRDLFGLPRKFNVSFDGAGRVSVATETNDIGFIATHVTTAADIAPGVYFRVLLGGITGHLRFANDCGLLVAPEECVTVAAAMLRVFAAHGDRTDRKKARLCYLLDRLGTEKFLDLVQAKLAFDLRFLAAEHCSPRPPVDKHGHIGIHRQTQPGLSSIGIVIPVGRMSAEQMLGLAELADTCGDGELRPTVWQNIILPNVSIGQVPDAVRTISAMGYDVSSTAISGCVVACTGNAGCRFSASDTKRHALQLAQHLDERFELDRPINIHLTGCPNSCAQHRVADIGLLGTPVQTASGSVEGYHVFIAGGVEQERGLGREFAQNVPFPRLPMLLEGLLHAYQGQRNPGESFVDFARRHDIDALRQLAGVRDE